MTHPVSKVTPAQAATWLFHQAHFSCTGVYGRTNVIGGLVLWTLAGRGLLPGRPPRLCLYGGSAGDMRLAAQNMAALCGLPCRFGRLHTYQGGGLAIQSEVLVAIAPADPVISIVEDRHAFVVLLDEGDPHRWHTMQSVARAVLPSRLSAGLVPHRPPFAVPNALEILCDSWLAAGKPGLDGGGYCWPSETQAWRAITEGVLDASDFPQKPRSVVTVDDI